MPRSHVKFARATRSSRGTPRKIRFITGSYQQEKEFYVSLVANAVSFTGPLQMFYVYLLENQNDKSWYIGFTSDLRRRVQEHAEGKGGKTTSSKKHWRLVYYEAYLNKDDAVGREKFLKSGSGRTYIKKQLRNYMNSSRF